MNKGNQVVKVDKYLRLVENWPFFVQGLAALRDPKMANLDCDDEEFRKVALRVIADPSSGMMVLLTSKNEKLLGYVLLIDAGCILGVKTARLLVLYSTQRCPSTIHELMYEAEVWSRTNGYKRVEALAYRPASSKTAFSFFEQKLRLDKKVALFYKDL